MSKLKLLDFNKISTSEQEADVKQDFVPTKVRWQTITGNGLWLCVCLPLAQSFKLPQMFMRQIAQNRCYKLAAVDYRKT